MNQLTIDPEFKSLIPPLSTEEREQLRENLRVSSGPRDALVVWKEEGLLLDGHNRYDMCLKEGWKYETRELSFSDRNEAKLWIIENQFGRRNLLPFVRGELGLMRQSILDVRARAKEAQEGIGKDAPRGRDEKGRLAPPVSANLPKQAIDTRKEIAKVADVTERQVGKIQAIKKDAGPALLKAARSGEVSINAAAELVARVKDPVKQERVLERAAEKGSLGMAREIKKAVAEERVGKRLEEAAAAIAARHPLEGEKYKLFLGDFEAGFEKLVEAGSVDAIICDPPYPEGFLPLFGRVAQVAETYLKPGGRLLVMSGQANLPAVFRQMEGSGLEYVWTLCYYTPGESSQQMGRRVKTNWKPVLYYVKGKNSWEHIEDVVSSDKNDKRFHEWGQSVGGMAQLISRFTVKGELVVDPFLGGGSTGIAAVSLGRLFVGMEIDENCMARAADRLRAP